MHLQVSVSGELQRCFIRNLRLYKYSQLFLGRPPPLDCRTLKYASHVTLIMGMAKAEGIYLSADYRVTEHPSGRLVNDASTKFLTVHYPPDKTGPKAVIAYTGLAFAPDGTPMGTWLRETLRGETEIFDKSMAHLRDRLDRDIAPTRWPMIVNALALQGDKRFFGGLTNLAFVDESRRQSKVLDHFGYVMNDVGTEFMFANGSGAAMLLAEGHFERCAGICQFGRARSRIT